MSVNSKHPEYLALVDDWKLMRDAYAGERRIKSQGTLYLGATQGMRVDGLNRTDRGFENYQSYLNRAVFPDCVHSTITAMIGLMHREPPIIDLPEKLAPLKQRATLEGESLQTLLRRINEQQLLTGRFGLLLDIADRSDTRTVPHIVTYAAEAILNWDQQRDGHGPAKTNLLVLDESRYSRQTFDWNWTPRYRLLRLDENGIYQTVEMAETDDVEHLNELSWQLPNYAGKVLDQIPFVFVGPNDITQAPDKPPLLDLANTALAIYRGEADYRQSLFMQGQDTLVLIGSAQEDAEVRVGAGAVLELPTSADAKFIGVSSSGLSEQRLSLENDRKIAGELGVALLDFSSRRPESGEALRVRMASKAATLISIARAGAEALEQILKSAAVWIGADPAQVQVSPNLAFAENETQAREIFDLMQSKILGAPISTQTIHRNLRRSDITDMSFAQEMDELQEEQTPQNDGGNVNGATQQSHGDESNDIEGVT